LRIKEQETHLTLQEHDDDKHTSWNEKNLQFLIEVLINKGLDLLSKFIAAPRWESRR